MATAPATRPEAEVLDPELDPHDLPPLEEGGRAPEENPETFFLEGVSWKTYRSLLRDFEAYHSNVRMTYDQGRLEFMSPSAAHEAGKRLIGRLIETMTAELNIPIRSGGGATFKRRLLEKGLEPDECYWVERESRVRGAKNPKLKTHPAPDLAIEVEWTRNVLKRLPIYGAFGFVEVWRMRRTGEIVIYGFGHDRRPMIRAESAVFPFLPMAEVARFLDDPREGGETRWIRSFRAWVIETLAPQHARPDDEPPA